MATKWDKHSENKANKGINITPFTPLCNLFPNCYKKNKKNTNVQKSTTKVNPPQKPKKETTVTLLGFRKHCCRLSQGDGGHSALKIGKKGYC